MLLLLTFMLVGFGLVMIFSASTPIAVRKYGDPSYFLHRQILFAVLGMACMFAAMNIPLPFVSSGGISLIACMAGAGILLGITRDNNRRRQQLSPADK